MTEIETQSTEVDEMLRSFGSVEVVGFPDTELTVTVGWPIRQNTLCNSG